MTPLKRVYRGILARALRGTGSRIYGMMRGMVVSMIQFRLALPPVESLKDKRRIIVSLKEKLANKFHLSVAEVDLQDSLHHAQIGAAVVSNSRSFGETVMHKALAYVETNCEGVLEDAQVFSETY